MLKSTLRKIKEKAAGIVCDNGGLNSRKLWNLKKEVFPKARDPPTAMLDPVSGNLLTSEEKIEEAAINVYKKKTRK